MIASLVPVASKLLGKFIEDKDTKNKLAHEISTMAEKTRPTTCFGTNKGQ